LATLGLLSINCFIGGGNGANALPRLTIFKLAACVFGDDAHGAICYSIRVPQTGV